MAENLGHSARKGVAWTTIGSLGNYGIHFVFNIILARLLSPEDFGICFMPVLFYTIAHICVEGGFSSALIREHEVTERDYNTAFWFRLGMGALFYGVLCLCSPLIAAFYDTPVLTDIIRVSGLSLVLVPLGMIPHVRFMRQLDFRTPALLGIAGALVSGISGVWLAMRGWGLWAIVWSGLMTDAFSQLLILLVAPWLPRWQFSRQSLRWMLGFGSKMQASQLLNTIVENLTPIFIGKMYMGHQLGLYMRALNWARIPSSGLTGIVGKVTFPIFSRLQDDRERLASAFLRIMKVTTFVIFPLMMGIAAISDPMVRVLLTDKWEGCIDYNRLLCLTMMWYPLHAINLQLLIAKGRSNAFLRLEIIKTVIILATLPIFYFGIMHYLVVMALLSLPLLWLNAAYTHQMSGVTFGQQIKALLPLVVFAMGEFAVVWLATKASDNIYWQFAAGLLTGIAYYVIVGRYCQREQWRELMKMARRV